jgi:hypothetical protein
VVAISSQVWATPTSYETYDYNQSTADIGRGGLHDYSPDNSAGMLANPAILAFVSGFHSTILDLQVTANGLTTVSNLQSNPPTQSNLNSYFGQNIYAGANAYSTLEFPYFGFAIYDSLYADVWGSDPAFPALNIESLQDLGYMAGFAFSINPNLGVGVNLKRVTRYSVLTSIGASNLSGTTTIQDTIKGAATGSGYGGDIGLLYRGEGSIHPTFSVDWKDAGWITFTPASGSTSTPPPLQDNLTVAVEFGQHYLGVGWMAGAEYRHFLNWDMDNSKKLNFGGELDLGIADVRTGLYEGYSTFGASIDLWLLTIDAAEYTVERGIYAGQNSDPRLQVGIRLEAALDPSFNVVEIGGKRRRLKQRR